MAESDRNILFTNETFLIGMLQAVSGGAVFAALAQAEAFVKGIGKCGLLVFLTLMALSLLCAVLAAYWKHQYKMWDVKAQASRCREAKARKAEDDANAEKERDEAVIRSDKAKWYLRAMRIVICASVYGIVLGIGAIIIGFWCSAVA